MCYLRAGSKRNTQRTRMRHYTASRLAPLCVPAGPFDAVSVVVAVVRMVMVAATSAVAAAATTAPCALAVQTVSPGVPTEQLRAAIVRSWHHASAEAFRQSAQ